MSYTVDGVRLKKHPGSQCRVQISSDMNEITFISYYSTVIRAVRRQYLVDNGFGHHIGPKTEFHLPALETKGDDCWYLKCESTFSRSTKQQITWFLEEYFNKVDLHDIQYIATKDAVCLAHLTKEN